MSIQAILNRLGEGQAPTNVQLASLSGLVPEDLAELRAYWPTIEASRRQQICRRLVELAEESAELDFQDIFRLLLEDEDAEVRRAAIDGLWECADRRIIGPLLTMVRNDAASAVRAAAAQLLGQFAARAELAELRPRDAERIRQTLLEVIEDPDEDIQVRRRAVEAISVQHGERIQAIIEEAYRSDEPSMRASALYAMGRNCNPRWLPILVRELASPNPELRYEAATACGELEDPRAVPHLIPLLDDADDQVQLAAISALGRIGGSTAKQALRRCLQRDDERLSQAAREALDEIAFGEDPLTMSLTD